eukprot:CAMPEP_0202728192 /NCGR_PEP_ID=MMETSP1385-20130828/185498_1 /ASSEMBLY_ACC=CAM_ASM_000861 /TAXON_ID=933848 /ORGANISM="Elphidium margaritaceum" /LENGTH=455 /DNA_ID=CAMNT_0049394439 /DNA_START=93 /DNA_END=1461 /DNA_ORIENTATION=+
MAAESNVPSNIAWEDDKGNKDEVSRGVTAVLQANPASHSFAAPQSMQKQAAQTSVNSFNSKSYKQPLQIITLEVDEVSSKDAKPAAPASMAPAPTNDIQSYAVKGQTPEQVLSGLTAVLVNYSQDMDIRLDKSKNVIEGVVFIENYYGVKFRINIWKQDDLTRFELLRNSGDALATSKFLGDIKTKFFIDTSEQNDANAAAAAAPDTPTAGYNMVSLSLDANSLDLKLLFVSAAAAPDTPTAGYNMVSLSLDANSLDLKLLFRQLSKPAADLVDEKAAADEAENISAKELDDVHEVLSSNGQESVSELQFLHERLKENGAIGKNIVSHEQLVKTIIAGAMKNQDVCVARGCLLILEQLCEDDKIVLLLVEQYALFENLVTLLRHSYALIRNYSVRLLARLSTQNKWNIKKDNAQSIEQLVKEYQSEWQKSLLANNGFLKASMFDDIYAKLAETNQ